MRKAKGINPYVYPGIRVADLPKNMRRLIKGRRRYNQDMIKNAIEKVTGVDFSVISRKTKPRPIAYARHIYCYQMRDKTPLSLNEIGTTIGRDHATIMHSIRKYQDLCETEDAFYDIASMVEDEIDIASAKLYVK